MFSSIGKLVSDVATVAIAPVQVAVDVTRIAVAPIASAANTIVEEVRGAADGVDDLLRDDRKK